MEITTAFNYAALDAETRIVVQQKTGEIKATFKRTLDNLSEMGEKFDEVRALLRHNKAGGFEAWYESEGFKRTFVYGCMDVFNNLANLPENGRLTFDISALFALAGPSTPVEARTEVIERAQAGEKITQKVVSEVKEKFVAPRSRSIPTGVIASKPITRVNDGDEFYEEAVINRDEPVVLPQSRPPSNGLAKQPTMSNVDPIRDPKAGEANHLVTKGYEQTGQAARTTEDILKELQDLRTLNANQETAMKELAAENERLTQENATLQKKLDGMKAIEVQPILMVPAAAYGISSALTSKYKGKYGENTLRASLDFLLKLEMKWDERELLGKVLELVKPAGDVAYPADVKKWKSVHTTAYYAEFGTALDALRTAWGQDVNLFDWDVLTVSEQRDFIAVQQELSGKLDCSEYPLLVKFVKVWKDAPLSMLPKKLTEWRTSLKPAPTPEDDFMKLWGEPEFIPTPENTDPQQAAEVRAIYDNLLAQMDLQNAS